jgi:hypothetical protein
MPWASTAAHADGAGLCQSATLAFSEAKFTALRAQLTERFGVVTAFIRAPARGTNEDGRQSAS